MELAGSLESEEVTMSGLGELPLLLFRNIGPLEIAIFAVVLLLLFGAARLPKIGTSLGLSLRAFKSAVTGQDEDEADAEEPTEKKARPLARSKEKL